MIVLERALFVVGPQESGKSTQLRSMFRDRRFGRNGEIPSSRGRVNASYYLSNERRLHLRLSSPHEMGEDYKEFFSKLRGVMNKGRWCFAGALQPDEYKRMPDLITLLHLFISEFSPERVRVLFLSPTRHNQDISSFIDRIDLLSVTNSIPEVEAVCIDARERERNGLFIADFFDYT